MTHDPLCPDASPTGCGGCGPMCEWCDDCQCDLIARVRADQDRRHAARELTRDAQDMGLIP